jgi:hypothetical protein
MNSLRLCALLLLAALFIGGISLAIDIEPGPGSTPAPTATPCAAGQLAVAGTCTAAPRLGSVFGTGSASYQFGNAHGWGYLASGSGSLTGGQCSGFQLQDQPANIACGDSSSPFGFLSIATQNGAEFGTDNNSLKNVQIDQRTHQTFDGTAQGGSVSTCGTSPSVIANSCHDNACQILTGTVSLSSCEHDFHDALGGHFPVCIVEDIDAGTMPVITASTTAHIIFTISATAHHVNIICAGMK